MKCAERLVKRYGSVLAVDDVSFEVGRGEIVGFLGPNGAGKSTTMKMLTGALWPDRGRVTIAGDDVTCDLAARARIGYLPEHTPLYRSMRVAAYLAYVAELRGLRAAAKRAAMDRVLASCDLQGWEDRRIRTLSKGYRQRVGLAQALIGDPEVLLLDEPTNGLDPAEIVRIRDLVSRLAREKTILLSTHVLPEVQEVCRRVIILAGGRLVADGSLLELSAGIGESLAVMLAAPEARSLDTLQNLEGVESVRISGRDSAGRVRFELSVTDGFAAAARVAALAAERSWPLFELRRRVPDLEQVFLAHTRGSAGPEEESADPSREARP
jgi:ABC-2 type transport system ATP-binding protein